MLIINNMCLMVVPEVVKLQVNLALANQTLECSTVQYSTGVEF